VTLIRWHRSFTIQSAADEWNLIDWVYAAVEAGDAASRFWRFSMIRFHFFVGNERPVLFAVGGDLQLVGVWVGK
jgi:hypothetical protein